MFSRSIEYGSNRDTGVPPRVIQGCVGVGLYNKRAVGSTTQKLRAHYSHMGGCQNYGPFLDPYYNTAPNI